MDLKYIICLLFSISVSCYRLICYCTNRTGDVLVLKNDAAPFKYSFPEIEFIGTYDHKGIINSLTKFGIGGKVGKRPIFYTSPEDRDMNPTRDKFVRVSVHSETPQKGIEKIWVDFNKAFDMMEKHPNENYVLFFNYAFVNSKQFFQNLGKDSFADNHPIWKKIVVICTDVEDQTLFVKNKKGLYILPEVRYGISKTRSASKSLADRLLRRYGIYGTIREKLWDAKRSGDKNNILEMVFHAIVYYKKNTGIGYVLPKQASMRRTLKVITYDEDDRIWLDPEDSRKILEPSAYLGAFEGVMSSNSWRLSLRKVREIYPNGIDGIENTGLTNSDDQVFGNYEGDSSVRAANPGESGEDEIYEDFYKTLEMLEID